LSKYGDPFGWLRAGKIAGYTGNEMPNWQGVGVKRTFQNIREHEIGSISFHFLGANQELLAS
jgi:hypothetical protein